MDNAVIQAEQAVLGAILYDNALMDACALLPEHFSTVAHRQIFTGFKALHQKQIPIDPVVLSQQLGDQLQQVGGTDYLMDLINSVVTTGNFSFYERMVLDASKLREAKDKANQFIADPTSDGIAELASRLDELSNPGDTGDEMTDQESLMKIYDSLFKDRGEISGVTTGIHDLDKMTDGLQDEDLIVVAGRPSMGKTAFVLNIAKAAAESNTVVDVFSLEMPKISIQQRLLSALSQIDAGKWRNPKRYMHADDVERLITAMGIYSTWHLSIHDRPQQTLASISQAMKQSLKTYPDQKHVVIIDYLSFIKVTGRYERRDLAVGAITSGLKQIARSYHVPIVLVAQLSRAVENRQDKRPMLSDLRESGNIEQDADLILFLYRESYYDKTSRDHDHVELIIAKHRNGPVGTVQATFIKEQATFLNVKRKKKEAVH